MEINNYKSLKNKQNEEFIEMNSDVAILAASSGTPSTSFGSSEIEGSAAQAPSHRPLGIWGDDSEE